MEVTGNRTHTVAVVQIIVGAVGIGCFLKPDLIGWASSIGVEILSPQEALLSLAAGLSQVFAGLKSIYSRLALAKVEKKVEAANGA